MEESLVEGVQMSKEAAITWLSPFESLIMFYNRMSKHWIVTWKLVMWNGTANFWTTTWCSSSSCNKMSLYHARFCQNKRLLKLERTSQHAQQAYADDSTEQGWEARDWPSNLWLKPWESNRTKEHKDTWNSTNEKHYAHISHLGLIWVGANPNNIQC